MPIYLLDPQNITSSSTPPRPQYLLKPQPLCLQLVSPGPECQELLPVDLLLEGGILERSLGPLNSAEGCVHLQGWGQREEGSVSHTGAGDGASQFSHTGPEEHPCLGSVAVSAPQHWHCCTV